MALIHPNTRLCDVVANDINVIPVINRFGILLGVGDKTVDTVCRDHKLDTGFVLAILNTFTNPDYFPEKTLLSFRAAAITDYLTKTYRYYKQFQLPNILRHFSLLIDSSPEGNQSLTLLHRYYLGISQDLRKLIDSDLTGWFPLVNKAETGELAAAPDYCAEETPTQGIADKLADLRNMFIMHLSGDYDRNLCFAVMTAVEALDRDFRQNSRIRNRILLPVSRELFHSAK